MPLNQVIPNGHLIKLHLFIIVYLVGLSLCEEVIHAAFSSPGILYLIFCRSSLLYLPNFDISDLNFN